MKKSFSEYFEHLCDLLERKVFLFVRPLLHVPRVNNFKQLLFPFVVLSKTNRGHWYSDGQTMSVSAFLLVFLLMQINLMP